LNGTEGELKAIVANVGPVVISMHVVSTFQFYKSGVYYDSTCNSVCSTTNHAMVAVGYGTDPVGGDYWLVKNSWGTGWGEQGYIKMARNKANNCNIACRISYLQ
jgi:cathepsin L